MYILKSQILHRSVLASKGGAVGMSKAADPPCLLLLLIWARNFKWSRERRKQMALVESFVVFFAKHDPTLWQRRRWQSDGLWCRGWSGSSPWRRPCRSCWSCWPAVGRVPECRRLHRCHRWYRSISSPQHHHINAKNVIILIIMARPGWGQRVRRRKYRLWRAPLNFVPATLLFIRKKRWNTILMIWQDNDKKIVTRISELCT